MKTSRAVVVLAIGVLIHSTVAVESSSTRQQSTVPGALWRVSGGGSAAEPLTATVVVPAASNPSNLYELSLRCEGARVETSLSTFTESAGQKSSRSLGDGPAGRDVLYKLDGLPLQSAPLSPVAANSARLGIFPPHGMPSTRILLSGVFAGEQVEFRWDALTGEQRKRIQENCFARPVESTTPPRLEAGSGLLPPRIAAEVKPAYTADAMRMRVEGSVALESVVLADGSVGHTSVIRCELRSRLQNSSEPGEQASRDLLLRSGFREGTCDETFGLDAEAIRAVKRWRFLPGRRNDGTIVSMIVEIEMSFRLK